MIYYYQSEENILRRAPDPVFDEKLGVRFTEEIIEILTKTILDVFKQWDTLLG